MAFSDCVRHGFIYLVRRLRAGLDESMTPYTIMLTACKIYLKMIMIGLLDLVVMGRVTRNVDI